MHFQSRVAILLPLLAALAVAAPVTDAGAPALKRSDLPDGCAFVNNDPSSHAIYCEYTSPHADAHPVITSNLPGACAADDANPYNVTCHVPGPPKSFGVSKRAAEPKVLDTSYKFSLVCDDNGCTKTTGAAKREAAVENADAEAYKFSFDIEWKRDVAEMAKRADSAADAEAYKLGIVIEWKRGLEEVAKREVATSAEAAYKFGITIEW